MQAFEPCSIREDKSLSQEQPQPQREATSPPGTPGLRHSQEEGPQGLADYGALLRQYGEAMLRIGQLEARVESLARQVGSSTSQLGEVPGPEPSNESRVMGNRIVPEPTVTSGAQVKSGKEPQNEEEIRQMRAHVARLTSQLAVAQEQLTQTNEHGVRRRRQKRQNRSLLKRLAYRMGLTPTRL